MLRGINRESVFRDNIDRQDFVTRLARLVPDGGFSCFAWALMPDHVHLVIRTNQTPLSRLMARLGTGYALRLNERHGRVGHLFQNRFKSSVVDSDEYAKTLVRYVHRNPVESGHVPSLRLLEEYPWTGHAGLMGRVSQPFLASEEVLGWFGEHPGHARRALREFMREPLPVPKAATDRLESGTEPPSCVRAKHEQTCPEGTELPAKDEAALREILARVCRQLGVHELEVSAGLRTERAIRARSLVLFLARSELGVRAVELARRLSLSIATAHRDIARGARMAADDPVRKSPPDEGGS
jgi:REP element-mobilizing transposase RayT